jgi:hypothetical protein
MSDRLDTYIQNVLQRLEELRRSAHTAIFHISNLALIQDDDGEQHQQEQWLEDYLRQQYRLLCDAFEKLDSQSTLSELKQGFARFTNLRNWRPDSSGDDFISPAQHFLSDYIELLSMHVRKEPETHAQEALKIFESIISGTAMIMEQQEIAPTNESEINRLMRTVVSAAFPDTISNPNIPTVVKTYKPEFGVPSLGALAEYKFAKTETELKQCLDGIMADSRGYQADGKWKRFYAVLFMTGAFFTPAQIEQQFKSCGIHDSWKAIVLVGKGGKKIAAIQQQETTAPTASETSPTAK